MKKRVIAVVSLGIFLSPYIFADFEYSCINEDGDTMSFMTTSLFGPNLPGFSYQDGQGLQLSYQGSRQLEPIKDAENWHVSGLIFNHPLAARFVASFPIVHENIDDVLATIKFKDRRGATIKTRSFLCQFSWQ
jgi:hypothetical protein